MDTYGVDLMGRRRAVNMTSLFAYHTVARRRGQHAFAGCLRRQGRFVWLTW